MKSHDLLGPGQTITFNLHGSVSKDGRRSKVCTATAVSDFVFFGAWILNYIDKLDWLSDLYVKAIFAFAGLAAALQIAYLIQS